MALEGTVTQMTPSTPTEPTAPAQAHGPMSAADVAANTTTVAYPNGVTATPSNRPQEQHIDGVRPEAEPDLEPGD